METLLDYIKSSFCTGAAVLLLLTLMSSRPAMAQGPTLGKSYKATVEVPESDKELKKELKSVYEATKRYQDIKVALKDGYIRDPMNMCEEGPVMGMPSHVGAMGVHYFRPDLLQITGDKPRVNGTGTYTDFRKPSILIYEPQEDGSMELVAVENLVFAKAWHKKHGEKMPKFMGYDYFTMIDNPRTRADEAHMFEPHYDLHVWLYRENPNGLFNPFNPNVSCEHHKGNTPQDMKMDKKKSGHDMNKSGH